MKKLFSEPEIEILTFLCDNGYDSPSTGGSSLPGGGLDDPEDPTIVG